MKKNIYGWIILLVVLIPTCILTAVGINRFLIFMTETPLYTNMSRYDDVDMTMKLPQNWSFTTDEDGFSVSSETGNETILFTRVNSAPNMETAKSLLRLSVENNYQNVEFKEGEIHGNTEIYYLRYMSYTRYYISGVVSNNGYIFNFVYATKISNPAIAPLEQMLSSIRFSTVPENAFNQESNNETEEIDNTNLEDTAQQTEEVA